MVISTHQIRFADEVADRVAFLSDGSILEEGPAHDILTNPRNPATARFLSVVDADKSPEQTA
jgi:polar amino acid transport system permease protein